MAPIALIFVVLIAFTLTTGRATIVSFEPETGIYWLIPKEFNFCKIPGCFKSINGMPYSQGPPVL